MFSSNKPLRAALGLASLPGWGHMAVFSTHTPLPPPRKRSHRDTPYLKDTRESLCSVAWSGVKTAHKSRSSKNIPLQTWAKGLRIIYILIANFSGILKLYQNLKKFKVKNTAKKHTKQIQSNWVWLCSRQQGRWTVPTMPSILAHWRRVGHSLDVMRSLSHRPATFQLCDQRQVI